MWNQGVVIESISKSILTAPWKCFRWGKASRRAAFRPGRVGQSAPELFIRSYTVKANHASKAARFPNTIQDGQTTCVKDFWSLSWFSCVVLVFAGTRYMFLPEISWGAVILFLLMLPLYKLFNPERQKNALNFLCKKNKNERVIPLFIFNPNFSSHSLLTAAFDAVRRRMVAVSRLSGKLRDKEEAKRLTEKVPQCRPKLRFRAGFVNPNPRAPGKKRNEKDLLSFKGSDASQFLKTCLNKKGWGIPDGSR